MQDKRVTQQAAVFMDHRKATIYTDQSGNAEFTISESIEADEDRSTKDDSHYNNSKRSDTRQYYKEVAKHILPYSDIYIFGPGQTQEEFINWLHEENKQFKDKKISIGSSDYITDNQKLARIRGHFVK
jgi:stalled ribosome rescue protein Dom34